jgi:signal transduction histidine kinase
MGILAHELRTPLATIALIGDAIRSEAQEPSPRTMQALEQLAGRLQAVARNMNRQIDMQISNAQLMRLPENQERLSAEHVARAALAAYPYRNVRERDCVRIQVYRDFEFLGTESLFVQVLTNLQKNALHALAARSQPGEPGDLLVEVDATAHKGLIMVSDRGPGIAHEIRAHLFELFASTHRGSGHGLGLAFCRRVVQEARGTIKVESLLERTGARFIIELPRATRTGRFGKGIAP